LIPIESNNQFQSNLIPKKMSCKFLIPIESKNQIDLGKHNSYQYRYQFKMKHDTNIENVSIYQNKVFFIIKNGSKISIENKID